MKTRDLIAIGGLCLLVAATTATVSQTIFTGKRGTDAGGTGCATNSSGNIICAAFVLDNSGVINLCERIYKPTITKPSCRAVGPASIPNKTNQ